jgi:hypothetical protein
LYREDNSFKAVLRKENTPANPGKMVRVAAERRPMKKSKSRARRVNVKLSKDTNSDFFIAFHIESSLFITERGKTHRRMKRKNTSIQKFIAAMKTEISALIINM